MNFIDYVTKEGDRLDLMAQAAYGNPFNISGIISANPTLPIRDVYPSGIRILFPIEETPNVTATITNLLPPWKR